MADAAHKARFERKAHAVVFYAYPKLIFTWPILLLGFAFWLLTLTIQPAPYSAWLEFYAWFYIVTLTLVILTISVDIERNYAVVWLVISLMIFFGGKWLGSATGIALFAAVYDFFGAMDVQYDRGFGLAVSVFLLVPFLFMLFWVRVNHKWRITHNEFEHYSWGRSDDSLARGAKRFRSTYPDLLEFFLGFGAGTLIVYSATGRTELRRIPNILRLPFLRKRIDRILEYTAVTTDDARNADLAESEEEEDESGGPGDEAEEGDAGDDDMGGDDDSGGLGDERL